MTDSKGFTLMEILIVTSVLAVLAALLVPMALKELDKADIAAAKADVRGIIKGIESFRADTKEYPDRQSASGNADFYHYLYWDGDMPTVGTANWGSRSDNLRNHLVENNRGYQAWDPSTLTGWRGPYLDGGRHTDPWGRSYLVAVRGFWDTSANYRSWILSAGPDGIVQTDTLDGGVPASSDDIGTWIGQSQ